VNSAATNDSDAGADELSLIQAMFALRGLMMSGEQFRHSVAEHLGVGLSETVAMSHLSIAGSLSPREVADRVGLTPSTVTSLLDRLDHAGLAVRAPHPTDRRKSVVTITEHGRDMLVRVQHWMRAALSELSPDRLPDTVAALIDLSKALDTQSAEIRKQTAINSGQDLRV
jgi:DNA-binding MarR family transcriptional regulator